MPTLEPTRASVVLAACCLLACGGDDSAGAGDAGNPHDSGADATTGDTGAGGDGGKPMDAGDASGDAGVMPMAGKACMPVAAGDHEQYMLPVATGLPSGVTFLTDWSAQPAHGGFYGMQIMDDCRYRADPNGFVTWHGKPCARVEVDPSDDPLALGENTERAEGAFMQDQGGAQIQENPPSGKQYYATSYYFPTSWAATFYPYSVFEAPGSTWPAGVSSDCASGAGTQCNSWSFVMQLYPWGALAAASTAPGSPEKLWFSAGGNDFQFTGGGDLTLGKWVDLVLSVDWATGDVTIYRRNEGETTFTQVVSGNGGAPPADVYFKQGLYRGGAVNGRTDVYWVGPTARGGSFAAVEMAAFGTSAGP